MYPQRCCSFAKASGPPGGTPRATWCVRRFRFARTFAARGEFAARGSPKIPA